MRRSTRKNKLLRASASSIHSDEQTITKSKAFIVNNDSMHQEMGKTTQGMSKLKEGGSNIDSKKITDLDKLLVDSKADESLRHHVPKNSK